MSEAADPSAPTRKIRPSIAALLSLFGGWGLGLYYAGRTRAAWWGALASVVAMVVAGAGVFTYMLVTHQIPAGLRGSIGPLDFISWGIGALGAIVVWIIAAKRQTVPRAGAQRLFGYLAIVLTPLLIALVLAMSLRFFAYQPFRMPSGSMQPTLMVGDYFVVSKSSYGYSRFSFAPFESLFPDGRWRAQEPQRGDLMVHRSQQEPGRDFVKRVVGVPGDRIQMIDGVLQINGAPVTREALEPVAIENFDGAIERFAAFRETLPNGVSYTVLDRGPSELDNTRIFVVPEHNYFAMGDDRDNALDSRMMGTIPRDYFIGRVDFIARSP